MTSPVDAAFAGPWQLAAAVQSRVLAAGGCTLSRGGVGVELDPSGAAIASWLNTPQALAQLLDAAARQEPPIPPLTVVQTLLRLSHAGLLTDTRTGWELPLPGTAFIGRLLRRIPAQTWLRHGQAHAIAAVVWLMLWLAFGELLRPPFGLDGTDVALTTIGVLVSLALARSLARGLAAQAVGVAGIAPSVRLRWQPGAEVGAAGMTAAERMRAQVIAISGISALSLALLGAATSAALSPQPLWRLVVWLCALALLVETAPALPTDARTLLNLATSSPALGGQARAWLARRALQNMWQRKPMSETEKRYANAATAAALHLLLAWLLTTRRLLPWTLALVQSGIHKGNALWAALPLALAVLWLVVLAVGMARFVLDLLRQVRPKVPRAKAAVTATDHTAQLLAAANNVPFLRALGADVLARLPDQMVREAWHAGETILRQGDSGDRLCCIVEGHAVVEWEDEAGLRHLLTRLGPGDFFGESAVLESTARTAHVVADGPVQLYALPREVSRALVTESGTSAAEGRRQLRHAAALRDHPLFIGLKPQELADVVAETVAEQHAAGAIILHEGEPGRDFYVILSGTCGVWRGGGQTGTLGPRDWFGELALLTGGPRNATVRAATDVDLLRIPVAASARALARDPAAAVRLWQVAAERLSVARGER